MREQGNERKAEDDCEMRKRIACYSFILLSFSISLSSMVLCESREMYSMVAVCEFVTACTLRKERKKKHRGVIDVKVPDIDKLPCE